MKFVTVDGRKRAFTVDESLEKVVSDIADRVLVGIGFGTEVDGDLVRERLRSEIIGFLGQQLGPWQDVADRAQRSMLECLNNSQTVQGADLRPLFEAVRLIARAEGDGQMWMQSTICEAMWKDAGMARGLPERSTLDGRCLCDTCLSGDADLTRQAAEVEQERMAEINEGKGKR